LPLYHLMRQTGGFLMSGWIIDLSRPRPQYEGEGRVYTPARRWSFLVGANEKSHTAQSRLAPLLINDEQTQHLLNWKRLSI
jgi:hypothetical protein